MQSRSAASRPAYFEAYENLASSRDEEGVLVLRFHADGGCVVFTGQTHQDFPAGLEELSLDRDNKALVITGTGDSFMDEIDGPSLGPWHRGRSRPRRQAGAYRTLQKQTLNLNLRRRITQNVPFGMALEGLTAADLAYQNST
jgi:enoyl-CoA hydratase/carnithine racemase